MSTGCFLRKILGNRPESITVMIRTEDNARIRRDAIRKRGTDPMEGRTGMNPAESEKRKTETGQGRKRSFADPAAERLHMVGRKAAHFFQKSTAERTHVGIAAGITNHGERRAGITHHETGFRDPV